MKQRIAHITDVHWMEPPSLLQLPFKRILGTANLYGLNRRHHFSERTQKALIEHIQALAPDALLFSGDLTAQATDKEFRKAFSALSPVLHTIPTFIVAGNHDVYTLGAHKSRRIEQHFAQWMHWRGPMQIEDNHQRHIIGIHASRPHLYLASGRVPDGQLEALEKHLSQDPAPGKPVVLVLHYPILDRHGQIYNGKSHGLLNAEALIKVLSSATRKPDLIIHGHVHHGFTVNLNAGGKEIPIHNCGSSGYSFLPDQDRTAHMNVYHFDGHHLSHCERYAYNGHEFEPEKGGAYATRR